MKRTPLKRGASLRRSPRRRATEPRALEPGEEEWKRPRRGRCIVCLERGRVVLHHVTTEQKIREATTAEQQAQGICWDPRNAVQICAPLLWGGRNPCHDEHHHPGVRDTRISYARVPLQAVAFAFQVLGEGPAIEYFRRNYKGAP